MRLVACHVENFGKLTDVSLSFEELSGMNVFCEENGWGKSTLATFIKVMFFGFDNAGKRNEIENERKHFKPWQGGVYGGQITFEAKGKTYVLSRTFGAKEDKDEFLLQDADTKLASSDFSEQIGEELFQIDRASFSRSIYISQNDCKTATTDQMNAKLGNLAEHTDDLNNYESANKRITDLLNSLSRTRKTGTLYKQKNQIAELMQEIKNGEALDASMEEVSQRKHKLQVSYASLKEEQKALQAKQKAASEYKDLEIKKKEYERLCLDVQDKERRFQQKRAFFPDRIPDLHEIDACMGEAGEIAGLKKELDVYRFSGEESGEWDSLRQTFASGVPRQEEIEEQHRRLSEQEEPKPAANRTLVWAGVAVLALGIVLFFLLPIAGALVSLAGIVAAAIGLFHKKGSPDGSDGESEIRQFLERYGISCEENGAEDGRYRFGNALRSLENAIHRYHLLNEKREKYAAALNAYETKTGKVQAFLSGLGMEEGQAMYAQLQAVKDAVRESMNAAAEYKNTVRAKEEYERQTQDLDDIKRAEMVGENASLTQTENRLSEISEELETNYSSRMAYDRQLEEWQERKDELADAGQQLKELQEIYDRNERKLQILQKTQKYLEQAKVSLTAKYTKPLQEGFDRYLGMLSGIEAGSYQLDANLDMAVVEQGMPRDIGFLSAGYRDMVGICMRMALIDAMYPEEKPFVLFDDPFANFDDDRTERGLRLLKEIAKEYQIIYFTCSRSRGDVS